MKKIRQNNNNDNNMNCESEFIKDIESLIFRELISLN